MRAKTVKFDPEQHDAVAAAMRMLTALNRASNAGRPHRLSTMWLNARQIWLEKPVEPAE